MKVKDLLKELEQVDPEKELLIETRFGYTSPSSIYSSYIKYDKESDDFLHESSTTKKKGFKFCLIIDNT